MVRREAIAAVADAGASLKVLDCYAGEGVMFRSVWKDAAAYLGMDKRFARRQGDPSGRCWRGNNETLIAKAMAADTWEVVDLDAWGNPWPLLRQVLRNARGQRMVAVLTCGLGRSMAGPGGDFAAAIAGASRLSTTTLLVRWYDDIIRWALAWCTRDTGWKVARARLVTREWTAGTTGIRHWMLELTRAK